MAAHSTTTGLVSLIEQRFAPLKGRSIGLVTNHTGQDISGKSIVDILNAFSHTDLKALFGPEHGIRGEWDELVEDGVDIATGLPIHSLYGARMRPAPEQLANIDMLVYDIQDIGCRFYTYISTLLYCMEAAAEAGLSFLVLDRPNPIGGLVGEGPLPDSDLLDFTACHPLPIRHGLTIAELARLFHSEKNMNLDLQIVPMQGWQRAQLWQDTGLPWINPSPNMRSPRQALLYPGIGLLEFTNISVGRGTDTPFEIIGAPWIDPLELASHLNEAKLPGLCFVPTRFRPTQRQHEGQVCGGIMLLVTEQSSLQPLRIGFTIAAALHRLYPEAWDSRNYLRLLANRTLFEALRQGASAEDLMALSCTELEIFQNRIEAITLY